MKSFKMITCGILIAGLSACQTTGTSPKDVSASYQDLKISLERDVCFGSCPAYVIEISQDGAVEFCGINFVESIGLQTRKVDPADVRRLYAMIEDANFYDLRDKYRGMVTDMPTYTVSVTADGQSKTVVDYAGRLDNMPESVTVIQKAIDDLAGVDEWIGEPSRDPILKTPDCAKVLRNG